MHFCGNPSRNWLPHYYFCDFLIFFHNLREIFRLLCSHARAEFNVWFDMGYISPDRFKNFIEIYSVLKSAKTYSFPIYVPTNFWNKSQGFFVEGMTPVAPLEKMSSVLGKKLVFNLLSLKFARCTKSFKLVVLHTKWT